MPGSGVRRHLVVAAACALGVGLLAGPVQADDAPGLTEPQPTSTVSAPAPEPVETTAEPDGPAPAEPADPPPAAAEVLEADEPVLPPDDDEPDDEPERIPPAPVLQPGFTEPRVGFHDSVFLAVEEVPEGAELFLFDPEVDEVSVCTQWGGPAFYCDVRWDWFDRAKDAPVTATFEAVYRFRGGTEYGPSTPLPITFQPSGFRPTSEPEMPAGDVLTIEGEYDYSSINTRIRWDVTLGGQKVVTNADCEQDEGESTGFSCTYDSTARAQVVAAALPTGPGSAVVREQRETDSGWATINQFTFAFDVADGTTPAPPAPAPAPGPAPDPDAPDSDDVEPAPDDEVPVPFGPGPFDPGPEGSFPDVLPPSGPEVPEVVATSPPPATTPVSAPVVPDALPFLLLLVVLFSVLVTIGVPGLGVAGRFAPGSTRVGGGATPTGRWPLADTTRTAGLVALTGAVVEGAGDAAGAEGEDRRGWGDRSITWRAPGRRAMDLWGRRAPFWLAPRLPMLARLVTDGAHLRAALGSLWGVVVAGGAILGLVAAVSTDGRPLAPALGVVVALLALSVLDAAAGAAAVTTFSLAVMVSGGLDQGLTFGNGVRGLIGLAALWFLVPLIASAARPLRRLALPGQSYPWDRAGDAVIAALLSGWAVQGIVGSLGDLVNREQAIVEHADLLGLITIGLVLARFGLEELVTHGYPQRLRAVVDDAELPEPTLLVQVRAIAVRAAMLAFFAWAFIGSCWQLWAGVGVFALPQLVALAHAAIPDVKPLSFAIPRGVVEVLVMVIVGAALAYWLDGLGDEGRIDAMRTGFVVLAVPGAALEVLGVLGGEPPEQRWTWPRQLAGAAVVVATVVLVVLVL